MKYNAISVEFKLKYKSDVMYFLDGMHELAALVQISQWGVVSFAGLGLGF